MKRVLGIDYGLKRVGLAISDPLGIFAQGFKTLEHLSDKQLTREIQAIIKEHQIDKVIIGLPVKTSGEPGAIAEATKAFGELIAQSTGLPVLYEDERFTSIIAQQSLREQGVQPSRRKHLVDQTSAALILQQYLDKASHHSPQDF